MEENVEHSDENGKKRKRDNCLVDNNSNDDVNMYLADYKSSQDNETEDNNNNKWLNGLRWTRSPEEAKYSDWSIEVAVLEETTTTTTSTTYSVHRNILGLQSEYFQSIFDGSFSESHQKQNTIELPPPYVTLHHFEMLLDYFYSGRLSLDHPLTAVAMVYFGDYLQIKKLKETSQNFIRNLIRNETPYCSGRELSWCYQGATRLRMGDLKDAVVRICAQRPDVMEENSVLMAKVPDTKFWCNVWEARKHYPNQTVSSTMKWSDNAASFIHLHRSIVDSKMFHMLTDINSLPIISPDAAVILMEQEQEFLKVESNNDDKKKGTAVTTVLTCLQRRCISSLYDRETGVWKISDKQPDYLQKLKDRLKKLPSAVLDLILIGTMEFDGIPRTMGLSIEVSGAGTEGVNGIYTMSGMCLNKPMFTRFSNDGSSQQYAIHATDASFYISVVPEGDSFHWLNDRMSTFYRQDDVAYRYLMPSTCSVPRGYSIPSTAGWQSTIAGEDPVPTLRLFST